MARPAGRLQHLVRSSTGIGNFHKAQARAFLRRLWMALNDGDHVPRFDLKKDIETLLAAYNDREGVTARFNLNLLERINRGLDADFDVSRFRHSHSTSSPEPWATS